MSFFDSLKSAAAQAASVTKSVATAAAETATKTYNDLKSEPNAVQCSACHITVEVPSDAFNWRCLNGHMNDKAVQQCTTCHTAKPSKLPNPVVSCPVCHATTEVPASNLAKQLNEASAKSKKFATEAAASTKATISHLTSAPDTFHCAHCDTLLAVPTGAWACQTCTTVNDESVGKCSKCAQSKSEQKAICGVCNQSTKIPASNFMNTLRHHGREVTQSSKKIYYDVSKTPYTSCPRCSTHIGLDVSGGTVRQTAAQPAATTQPTVGVEQNVGPVPADQLECPSCKHRFEKPAASAAAAPSA